MYRVVQKKRHKVNDTIILQSYVMWFSAECFKKFFLQQLNILCYCRWKLNDAKTVLPSTSRSMKTCYCYFMNSSVKHWPNLIIFGMRHLKKNLTRMSVVLATSRNYGAINFVPFFWTTLYIPRRLCHIHATFSCAR